MNKAPQRSRPTGPEQHQRKRPRSHGQAGHAPDSAETRVRLTRREFEVLSLLAEGQTDREIAAALLVSTRTVSTHVAHILAEFGVTRRTAAAVRAVRFGLI